ncbi:MAG: DUF2155 domain-containing protein [Alphaproteobacteria bacterium]|nr:DUF2155 domain-containing protein [Alphaproteobacteria bacterium]
MRAVFLALSVGFGLAVAGVAVAQSAAPPLPPTPPPTAAPTPRLGGTPGSVAILRGLDKVTGQYRDFQAAVGKTSKFHTLDVTVRACEKSAAEEAPETAVFMEVTDTPLPKKGAEPPKPTRIFSGWVFGSSPALNALEHPVYDVWAIDCR